LNASHPDYARKTGRVTMGDMLGKTGASRNTLKEHFRNLVEKKLLVQQGAGRATTYVLP
jgi:predicted HTH transcriptional regulator